MRTIFTGEDVKNYIEYIFNGNLKVSSLSEGRVEYENPNTEEVLLVDEETGEKETLDLAKYLNIKFYAWKNRLVQVSDSPINSEPQYSTFEDWVKSLNFSIGSSYALVEVLDEDAITSQDIDSATKIGRITFLININKVSNLDYYVAKIRNKLLGAPQSIQNSFGDMLNAYITVGTLLYDEEPSTTQIGETMVVSSNFRISYLNEALSYTDTKIEISLDGDDLYNAEGEIVDTRGVPTDTKYMEMPITRITWQNIFGSNPVPTWGRADMTGFVANTLSTTKTLSFYDFNKDLTMRFNDMFWRVPAYRVNGIVKTEEMVNVPVFIRVTSNGNVYTYKDMIDNMQKVLTNNDFNISSITLKGLALPSEQPDYLARLGFDSNQGEPIYTAIIVYEGQVIGELPTPVRAGYDFEGWFIDGIPINSGTIWEFGGDKTAVAQWRAKTYTLYFDKGDGIIWTQKTVTYNQEIGELPTPEVEGLVFSHWQIGVYQIEPYTGWLWTEDKTAVAWYKPIEFDISQERTTSGGFVNYEISMTTNVPTAVIEYTITTTSAVGVGVLPEPVSRTYSGPFDLWQQTSIQSNDITQRIDGRVMVDGIVVAEQSIVVNYGQMYT